MGLLGSGVRDDQPVWWQGSGGPGLRSLEAADASGLRSWVSCADKHTICTLPAGRQGREDAGGRD